MAKGKIGQQLLAIRPQQRATRTQRVEAQQEYQRNIEKYEDLQQRKQIADEQIQKLSPEEYASFYDKLDEDLKEFYISPSDYYKKPEVKEYFEQKKKYEEAKSVQEDYELAKKYANYYPIKTLSDYYMTVSFKERATSRQLKFYNEIIAKKKAILETYEQSKKVQIPSQINQSELITIGQSSGLIKRLPNESDQSYNYRLAQLGKSMIRTSPEYSSKIINYERVKADIQNYPELPESQYKESIKPYYEYQKREILEKAGLIPTTFLPPMPKEESQKKETTQTFLEKASQLYKKIPNPPLKLSLGLGLTPFGITPYKPIGLNIDLTAFGKETERRADIKIQEIKTSAIGKENIARAEQNFQANLQQELQQDFEIKYKEGIERGYITFEESVERYEQSDYYKQKISNYERKWQETQIKLFKDLPFRQELIAYSKAFPFQLTKISMYPLRGTKELALTGVAFYTIPKIPIKILVAGEVALASYGAYKTFSPKSSFEESLSGFTLATLSVASLSSTAYKYYRLNKFKPVDIEISKPKLEVKSSLEVSKGIEMPKKIIAKKLSGETIVYKKVIYPASTQITARPGFRREFYTFMDYYLNKYLGMSRKPFYSGIPTYKKSITYDFGFFRYTKLQPRQAIFNWYKSLGKSNAEINAIMRYTAPKLEISTSYGYSIIKYGDKIPASAKGEVFITTTKPRLLINKNLKIYTRGRTTEKTILDFEKIETGTTKTGATLVNERIIKTSGHLIKDKFIPIPKKTELFLRRSAVTQSKIYKQPSKFELLSSNEFLVRPSFKYQIVKSDSLNIKLGLPKNVDKSLYKIKEIQYSKDKMFLIKTSKKEMFVNEGDLYRQYGIKVQYKPQLSHSQKTVKRIQMPSKEALALKKDIREILSKEGRVLQTQKENIKSNLYSRQQSQTAIKLKPEITKAKQSTITRQIPITTQSAKSFSSIFLISKIRQQEQQITLSKIQLRQIAKSDEKLKQEEALKETPKLRESVKLTTISSIKNALIFKPNIPIKITKPTPTKPIKPKTPKPIFFGFGSQKAIEKEKSNIRFKRIEAFALMPDFTARMTGLQPIKAKTSIHLRKEIRKIRTGLEIRQGIKI